MKRREPKKGDRCEYAEWSQKTMGRERKCPVRHLEGKPPGQLMPVKYGREHVIVCGGHAQKLLGGLSIPIGRRAVKKQKRGPIDAVQVDIGQVSSEIRRMEEEDMRTTISLPSVRTRELATQDHEVYPCEYCRGKGCDLCDHKGFDMDPEDTIAFRANNGYTEPMPE